jgi:hypothetical protein
MEPEMNQFVQPTTFNDNALYWLLTPSGGRYYYNLVRFIKYDPCPAFVIILDGAGLRRRCLRQNLWILSPKLEGTRNGIRVTPGGDAIDPSVLKM